MSWTYTAKPGVVALDTVRLLIGDTDECDQVLQDEEILYYINEYQCPRTAAIESALAIAAKYSRLVDESVGQVRVSFSQRADHFYKLADRIKERQSIFGGIPIAGGLSISEKNTIESNHDRFRPGFTKDLHDNPRIYPSDEDESYGKS